MEHIRQLKLVEAFDDLAAAIEHLPAIQPEGHRVLLRVPAQTVIVQRQHGQPRYRLALVAIYGYAVGVNIFQIGRVAVLLQRNLEVALRVGKRV